MQVSFFKLLKKLSHIASNATPILSLQRALGAFYKGLLRRPAEEKILLDNTSQKQHDHGLPQHPHAYHVRVQDYQWKKRDKDAKITTQKFREQARRGFAAQARLEALANQRQGAERNMTI